MIKYEYRSTGRRTSKPKLLKNYEFRGLAGFRSLFGFSKEAIDHIEYTQATRGVGKFPLYMDTLILDFDDNPLAQEKAKEWLEEKGYGYTTYTTGNRGEHIHIPIEPMQQIGLAPLVKSIVQKLFPGADESIYKPTGVIRLPGTYHSKTGSKMCKLNDIKGTKLRIINYKPEGFAPIPYGLKEQNPEQLEAWLIRDLHKYVGDGGRNNHLFHICATAIRLGYPFETTEELARSWNETYASPSIREGEFFATLKSAYKGDK